MVRMKGRLVAAVVLAAAVATAGIPDARHGVLAAVGRQLVYEDAVTSPAYIALLSGTGAAARLEVADLAARATSAPVIVFDSSSEPLAAEFARRGATLPTEAEQDRVLLQRLGVAPDRLRVVRTPVGGTNGEVSALAADSTLGAGGAVVVSWHHSARLRRIVRRTIADPARRPAIVVPRYAREWQNGWWRDRGHLRLGLTELQKLALDVVAHPLS